MIKSLLTSVALVATVLTANASDVVLFEGSEDMTNNYWPGLIITKQPILDAGANSVLTIDFTKTGEGVSYKLCTNWTNTVLPSFENVPGFDSQWSTVWTSAESPITFTFTQEDIDCLRDNGDDFRISGGGEGFKITKVTLSTDVEIDPNLLWEGEYVVTGWKSGAEVSMANLKVGDIVEYTFSNAGKEGNQVLVKNSSWGEALGTTKITPAIAAQGTVQIGVTQELLDNCGGKIFLSGDGEITVTKAYRIEAGFDATNVLVWGERALGMNVYTEIPEGVKYINATFTKVPEWLQLCNSSWTEIAQPVNRIYTADDAPVTYQFEATPELVSAINEVKDDKGNPHPEFVFNGGGADFVSLSVGDELIVDYDLENLKRVESVEDVPASYSTPLDITYEELPGFGKGSQLVITYTCGTTDLELSVYAVVEGEDAITINNDYPAYGTGYVIIPLTEEQATAIRNGVLRIEGHDMIINRVYYSEGEEITGIADVTVDANAPVEYYNLQGIKISADDATNGIFIRRQGGKSVKVAR